MRKLLLLLLLTPALIQAQPARSNIQDTVVNAKLFSVNYCAQLPGGDMAERFGFSYTFGANFLFKVKGNWLFGVEANYLFGAKVKEDSAIYALANSSGSFTATDGSEGVIDLNERGYMLTAKVGKIIPAFGSNPNSGIMLLGGLGFIQHKIKIIDVFSDLPQFEGAYLKGYDKLSNGILLTQFIGYSHLDKRKLINFYAGLEVMEGFTQSRRDWNFTEMKKDDKQRFDLLFGLKAGWILPFYGKDFQQFYTY